MTKIGGGDIFTAVFFKIMHFFCIFFDKKFCDIHRIA